MFDSDAIEAIEAGLAITDGIRASGPRYCRRVEGRLIAVEICPCPLHVMVRCIDAQAAAFLELGRLEMVNRRDAG